MSRVSAASDAEVLGHPPGLFVLFFAEMWERFSYYGMRALLVFYMIKGFLRFGDEEAYEVYGAYTALVYATPFVGGILADRVLGSRRAVVIGGTLMALGHLMMTIETAWAFFLALSLLIVGNGFFKPNVSTMVGELYAKRPERKDAGFTLFYMGINLGAAIAPLLCSYVAERYGWHYGFGLATVGMLGGLAVFAAPVRLAQILIVVGAAVTSAAMFWAAEGEIKLAVNGFVALALVSAAAVSFRALGKGKLSSEVGAPPEGAPSGLRVSGGVAAGVLATVAVLASLVQFHDVATVVLSVFGVVALGSLVIATLRADPIERQRLSVIMILMFFSMLFWAFFEQAGSSLSNFADRNVDRVAEARTLEPADVGQVLELHVGQEQLGYSFEGAPFTMDRLDAAKKRGGTLSWKVQPEHVGMGVEGSEVAAAEFQSANPIFILLFGLVFSALWSALGSRGREPSTAVKFALGIAQLGLGFGVLWYGAEHADARGMVSVFWLLLAYLLMTTGELCLSPVGLSMVTKLSPARIGSMVMGAWFLAMAFSNLLAGMIATLTGVSHGGDGEGGVPVPAETVGVYGDVFLQIALTALASSIFLFVLAPLLGRWTHAEQPET